jgi:hypothetical protein
MRASRQLWCQLRGLEGIARCLEHSGYAGTLFHLDNVGRDDLREAWHSVDLETEEERLKRKHFLLEVRDPGIALPPGLQ